MREYGRVKSSLWRSKKFASLGQDGDRLLYLYLHTCPHANSAGCYVLPLMYIAHDLGWSVDQSREAIDRLSKAYLIAYNEEESVVQITDFLKHDPATNEKHAKGILNALEMVPDCPEKLSAAKDLKENPYASKVAAIGEAIDRLSKAFRNPPPPPPPHPDSSLRSESVDHLDDDPDEGAPEDPDDDPDDEPESPRGNVVTLPEQRNLEAAFDRFWDVCPRKVGKKKAKAKFKTEIKNGADPESMISAMARYKASRSGEDPKFTVHPITWLNQGRWQDEDLPATSDEAGGKVDIFRVATENAKRMEDW